MSVSPTDSQCCMPTDTGLRCTKALIYGGHSGPHVHEHDRSMASNGTETICGCRFVEPSIRIDGHPLTEGQVTAVRVAVSSFLSETRTRDDLGPIKEAYIARLEEVETLIVEGVTTYQTRYGR